VLDAERVSLSLDHDFYRHRFLSGSALDIEELEGKTILLTVKDAVLAFHIVFARETTAVLLKCPPVKGPDGLLLLFGRNAVQMGSL
jgi:hypothetical protein